MLVTVTNITSDETVYVSTLANSLEAGESSGEVRRSASQIDDEFQLKDLVAEGKVSMGFVAEPSDSVGVGFMPAPLAYTSATRPDAADVPANTAIWNIDDNAMNWSDGTAWRDSDGNLT